MKVAKASREEQEQVLRFVQKLEDEIKYPEMSDTQLAEFVRETLDDLNLFRVAFGYMVLVDNCCDPSADALEWKPELKAVMESAFYKEVARNHHLEQAIARQFCTPPAVPLL